MDALAAIIMPGFKESNWTDQEVGVAIGRKVLIVPIIHGLIPYGFIGKYQGLKTGGKTVSQVAKELFGILIKSPKTRVKMMTCIIDTALQSRDKTNALEKLHHLDEIEEIPAPFLERLREGAALSPLFDNGITLDFLNIMLEKRGHKTVYRVDLEPLALDDLPF